MLKPIYAGRAAFLTLKYLRACVGIVRRQKDHAIRLQVSNCTTCRWNLLELKTPRRMLPGECRLRGPYPFWRKKFWSTRDRLDPWILWDIYINAQRQLLNPRQRTFLVISRNVERPEIPLCFDILFAITTIETGRVGRSVWAYYWAQLSRWNCLSPTDDGDAHPQAKKIAVFQIRLNESWRRFSSPLKPCALTKVIFLSNLDCSANTSTSMPNSTVRPRFSSSRAGWIIAWGSKLVSKEVPRLNPGGNPVLS